LNAPTAAKCRKCGAELAVEVQEFECPRCGQKNPLTVAACENCGLTAEEAADYEE
jgi:ribosomal protein L40E